MAHDSAQQHPSGPPELEGYNVLGEIGRGGYGVVYKAEQKVLGRTVAIKDLNVDFSNDPGLLERFIREARIVAQIGGHENIVQVYDVKENRGSPCIVMEFIEGTSLADKLNMGEKFDLAEAVRIISYTARALQHAHDYGIIHRDIKPENIMINRKGKIKVMDFGIAFSGDLPRITQRGFAVGTPQYMSPEQLRGKPVDGRSDIYSLSVLFFYLVAGRLPFDDPDPRELGLKHIRTPAPSPTTYNPSLPIAIERIILRGLEKKPEDRFQHARELEEGLADFLMKSSQPSLTSALAAFEDSRAGEIVSPGMLATPGLVPESNESDFMSDIDDPSESGEQAPPPSAPAKPPVPERRDAAEASPFERPQAAAPKFDAAASTPAKGGNMGLLILLVLIILVAAAGVLYVMMGRTVGQFESMMERGNSLLRRGDLDAAEKAFGEALILDPSSQTARDSVSQVGRQRANFEANLTLGTNMLERDPAGAYQAFEQALRVLPNNPRAKAMLERAREAATAAGVAIPEPAKQAE